MSTLCGHQGGESCEDGAFMEFCQTEFGNTCTYAYYLVGNETFGCASCSDTAGCLQQAENACGPIVIDSGPPADVISPPDDVGPVPDAPFGDAGEAVCTPHACGTMGQTMDFCESFDTNNTCIAAWYEVAGQIFDCNSCSDCMTAAQEASKACP